MEDSVLCLSIGAVLEWVQTNGLIILTLNLQAFPWTSQMQGLLITAAPPQGFQGWLNNLLAHFFHFTPSQGIVNAEATLKAEGLVVGICQPKTGKDSGPPQRIRMCEGVY